LTRFLDVNGNVDFDSIVDLDLDASSESSRGLSTCDVEDGVDIHVAVNVNDARQRSRQ